MPSWWQGEDVPRVGFTQFAAKRLNADVQLDDVSDTEFSVIVKRQQVLSALIGIQQGKRTAGICHANVVSRN